MIVAIHEAEGKKIVTICDSSIIGEKFEEGKRQLDLTSSFYKGEEKQEKDIAPLLNDAYIVQFTGEEAVAFGIKQGIIDKNNIINIGGIPHAEGVILRD